MLIKLWIYNASILLKAIEKISMYFSVFLSSSCCYTQLLVVYVTCNLDRCGKNLDVTEKKNIVKMKTTENRWIFRCTQTEKILLPSCHRLTIFVEDIWEDLEQPFISCCFNLLAYFTIDHKTFIWTFEVIFSNQNTFHLISLIQNIWQPYLVKL